ncbi:hypothetical protein [Rhodopirellula europaea]|nr:hypothetical protein [Rhodopirellula europaea]
MNRNLVKGTAVVALMLGASLAFSSSASAFKFLHSNKCCNSGGLFSGLKAHKCGGGLLAKLKAKDCCAPEPCCEPAPAPCCEPAPEPCCEPAPAPCCEAAPAPAPCCGEPAPAPVVEAAPCCGGEVAPVMEGSVMQSSEGFDLAPGETLVPGSVVTGEAAAATEEAAPAAPVADAEATEEAAPPAPVADEAPAAEAPAAEEAAPAAPAAEEVKSSSDQVEEAAPPVPQPDANTDI